MNDNIEQVVSKIEGEFPSMGGVAAGRGGFGCEQKTCVKSLTPKALFRGHQDPEKIFSEIDILVHPSTTFDSLPTALIEAARAGIPCIASSNGGAEEIIQDEDSGFLFDSTCPEEGQEKLKRLLDYDLRKEMGTNAREIFEEKFAVGRMVGEYKDILV